MKGPGGWSYFLAFLFIAVLFAVLFTVVGNDSIFWYLALPILLVAWYFYNLVHRDERLWESLAAKPFPAKWKKVLEEDVQFYRNLDEEDREWMENKVRFFLHKRKIELPGNEERHKVLVAASAVTTFFDYPDWAFVGLKTIHVSTEGVSDATSDSVTLNLSDVTTQLAQAPSFELTQPWLAWTYERLKVSENSFTRNVVFESREQFISEARDYFAGGNASMQKKAPDLYDALNTMLFPEAMQRIKNYLSSLKS